MFKKPSRSRNTFFDLAYTRRGFLRETVCSHADVLFDRWDRGRQYALMRLSCVHLGFGRPQVVHDRSSHECQLDFASNSGASRLIARSDAERSTLVRMGCSHRRWQQGLRQIRLTLRFWNMNDRQAAAIPGASAAADVPGHINLVSRGRDGGAVSAFGSETVLFLIERVQKSEHLLLAGLDLNCTMGEPSRYPPLWFRVSSMDVQPPQPQSFMEEQPQE